MKTINRNLLVAPSFPDGEIVNAFLIRLLTYSGSPSLSLACRRLLNRRPGLAGMPSSLGKFHEELGHLYGDIDALIDKHTDYNFICCGLPRQRFAAQRARLIGMYRGPVRLCRLPLLFTNSENCYLQCSECAELQKREFGFAFIHRRMGAPFVSVCPIHGTSLCNANSPGRLFDSRCQSKPNNYQMTRIMELGERIEHCMEISADESKYHKNDLLELMKESGWFGKNQRFHVEKFQGEFASFFAGAFADDRLKMMCQSDRLVENAIRALLHPEKALHPEWCVLFKWFAEEQHYHSPNTGHMRSSETGMNKHAKYRNVVPSRETIESQLGIHRTLSATADSMGVSVLVLSALCRRYCVDVSWRPKTLTPQLSEEMKYALESGMVPFEVAERFNVSLSSVYRQLAILDNVALPSKSALAKRIEADKEEWVHVFLENPDLSRNTLRRLHRALWMRLYRNDPVWLEAHLPASRPHSNGKKTGPPDELVTKLNQALKDAIGVCTDPAKKRVHVSQNRLRTYTSVTSFALKSLTAKGIVEQYEEPRSDYVKARLAFLTKLGERPIDKLASVAKKAGLRTETVRKELEK
jgi:hypothetical protein